MKNHSEMLSKGFSCGSNRKLVLPLNGVGDEGVYLCKGNSRKKAHVERQKIIIFT